MVNIQREMLCELTLDGELDGLLQTHYEELCSHRDRKVLAPRWEVYAALERDGRFMAVTARDEGALVGYAGFFVDQHMHYEAYRVATNDVLFLAPAYREGGAGVRLIKQCKEFSRADGCQHIVWRAKPGTVLFQILSRMRDYAPEETAFGSTI